MTDPEDQDNAEPSPDHGQGCGLGIVVVVLFVIVLIGFSLVDNDDSSGDTTPRESLKACPDYLEVAGPYRQGIDPEYDPAMDWDGDGVSCE